MVPADKRKKKRKKKKLYTREISELNRSLDISTFSMTDTSSQ